MIGTSEQTVLQPFQKCICVFTCVLMNVTPRVVICVLNTTLSNTHMRNSILLEQLECSYINSRPETGDRLVNFISMWHDTAFSMLLNDASLTQGRSLVKLKCHMSIQMPYVNLSMQIRHFLMHDVLLIFTCEQVNLAFSSDSFPYMTGNNVSWIIPPHSYKLIFVCFLYPHSNEA